MSIREQTQSTNTIQLLDNDESIVIAVRSIGIVISHHVYRMRRSVHFLVRNMWQVCISFLELLAMTQRILLWNHAMLTIAMVCKWD
jgi:hypothetical protein